MEVVSASFRMLSQQLLHLNCPLSLPPALSTHKTHRLFSLVGPSIMSDSV